MEIYGSQRKIKLKNGEQLVLYCFNDGNHDFWVTKPEHTNTTKPLNKRLDRAFEEVYRVE